MNKIEEKVGIYKISLLSQLDKRILYVGQSKYLYNRIKTHKRELRQNRHFNPYLQAVVNRHGLKNLKFELIIECKISELDALEQFYIDELKPECNIVRDVLNFHETKYYKQSPLVYIKTDFPGLELDYAPKEWHRRVYAGLR